MIVAGTPPLAPINPINQTVCAGSPNPPLSVSVVGTDPLHPAATIAIDWFNAAGIRVATNTPTYIPTDTDPGGPNASAEYDYFAEARDLRTGFVYQSHEGGPDHQSPPDLGGQPDRAIADLQRGQHDDSGGVDGNRSLECDVVRWLKSDGERESGNADCDSCQCQSKRASDEQLYRDGADRCELCGQCG